VEAQQTLAKLLAAEPLSETSHAWRIFLGMMILKVFVVEDIDVDVWYWIGRIGLVELSYTVFLVDDFKNCCSFIRTCLHMIKLVLSPEAESIQCPTLLSRHTTNSPIHGRFQASTRFVPCSLHFDKSERPQT
jgi:hypothetical protein